MGRVFRRIIALFLLSTCSTARAQFGPEQPDKSTTRPALASVTAAAAEQAFKDNLARYKDNPDYLVRDGLVANRKEKWVRMACRATSLVAEDAIEFLLISDKSGKGYEALAESFAMPSDVHAALQFIGMKPGRPVDFEHNIFWPKGDRVLLTVTWLEPPPVDQTKGKPTEQSIRAEDLVIDTGDNNTLPHEGFVYAGSYWLKPEGEVNGGKPMYAPDALDSGAIASDYNDRASVLDVPRKAAQGSVYGSLKINPAHRFTPGQAVEVRIEPESKEGKTRIRDLNLFVNMPAGAAVGPEAAQYTLKDADGKNAMEGEGNKLAFLLAAFNGLNEAGLDPFVTVHLDKSMSVANVRQIYALLANMDNSKGIRIEAPPEGELYYRAFLPKVELLDRKKRLGRPWELHLQTNNGQPTATLILPADDINDNDGQGDLKFPVAAAEEMAKVLAEKSDKWSQDVLIYSPPELSYDALLKFIGPSLKTHPTMYVFVQKPANPRPE